MLQIGLIILTVIWRMVHFSHNYDKRDEFDFPKVNLPYLSSKIPESPAYGLFISQLIRYARLFFLNMKIFSSGNLFWFQKLLKQGYSSRKHQTTFQKFHGRHTDLVCLLTVTYE